MIRAVAFLGLALAANAQFFNYLHPLRFVAPAAETKSVELESLKLVSSKETRVCPPTPPLPPQEEGCLVAAVISPEGCVLGFRCYTDKDSSSEESGSGPEPCPPAPSRPEGVDGCNWIAIQNARGCILDYECEPKGPEPCPPAPMRPDESHRCKWTAIKNSKGCIIDYECEPRRPFQFGHFGYPYGYHLAPAPLSGFNYAFWQQYFQAALARGMAQGQQPQAPGGAQGQEPQGAEGDADASSSAESGSTSGESSAEGGDSAEAETAGAKSQLIPTKEEGAVGAGKGKGTSLTTGSETRGAGAPRKH